MFHGSLPTTCNPGVLNARNALGAAAKERTKFSVLSLHKFIFANEVGGFLDTDNYRKRVLHKLARELELPK